MERKIIAIIGVDDDTAFEKIDDGPVPYLEKEFGWLQQSGIVLKDCFIADEDENDKWQAYLNYLVEWSFNHQDDGFAGMTPTCYDEWFDNEGAEIEANANETVGCPACHGNDKIYPGALKVLGVPLVARGWKKMYNESKLLAFVRHLYKCEQGSCGTCTEHDGYSCQRIEGCKWSWKYAQDVKDFEIPDEVVSMEPKKAIETLDKHIPHPADNMVDREHIDIAIAWAVIKADILSKYEGKESKTSQLFVSLCECLPDYSEGRIWSTGDEILVKDAEAAETLADLLELYARAKSETVLVNTGYYDPDEDKRSGEEDRFTGWHYVNIG